MVAELVRPTTTVRHKLRRNTWVSYLLAANRAMFLGNAFMQTYYELKNVSTFGVYLLQIVLYGASLACGTVLGRMGDRYGNKRAMVLGASLAFGQSVVFVFCDSFFEFVPALVAVGIYITAFAGNAHTLMDATINEEVTCETEGKLLYHRFLSRESSWHGGGYALGVLTGGWLHDKWGLSAPFYAQPLVYAVTVVLTLCFVSPRQVSRSATAMSRTPWYELVRRLFDNVQVRSVIQLTVFAEVLALTCFWVIQSRMKMAGIGEDMFMWAYFGYALAIIVVSYYMQRLAGNYIAGWSVAVVSIASGVALAGTTTSVLGVAGIFVVVLMNTTLASRLSSDMLRDLLPEGREERTTEVSMIGTIAQVVSGAVGLVFGACVEFFGLHASLYTLALVAAVAGVLVLRSFHFAMLQKKN